MIPRGVVWLVTAGILMVTGLTGAGRPARADMAPGLTVIDGDTLSRGGELVQLSGIDAPELGQQCHDGEMLYACGLAAAYELEKILTLEPVTCARSGETGVSYECHTPDGSLSQKLVEDGLAVALSGTDLEPAQDKARHVPLGIWRGKFVPPEAWRAGTRLVGEPSGTDACPVLGFQQNSRQVYVVPTDADYESISRDKNLQLQRFCSDEAARSSGYVHLAG